MRIDTFLGELKLLRNKLNQYLEQQENSNENQNKLVYLQNKLCMFGLKRFLDEYLLEHSALLHSIGHVTKEMLDNLQLEMDSDAITTIQMTDAGINAQPRSEFNQVYFKLIKTILHARMGFGVTNADVYKELMPFLNVNQFSLANTKPHQFILSDDGRAAIKVLTAIKSFEKGQNGEIQLYYYVGKTKIPLTHDEMQRIFNHSIHTKAIHELLNNPEAGTKEIKEAIKKLGDAINGNNYVVTMSYGAEGADLLRSIMFNHVETMEDIHDMYELLAEQDWPLLLHHSFATQKQLLNLLSETNIDDFRDILKRLAEDDVKRLFFADGKSQLFTDIALLPRHLHKQYIELVSVFNHHIKTTDLAIILDQLSGTRLACFLHYFIKDRQHLLEIFKVIDQRMRDKIIKSLDTHDVKSFLTIENLNHLFDVLASLPKELHEIFITTQSLSDLHILLNVGAEPEQTIYSIIQSDSLFNNINESQMSVIFQCAYEIHRKERLADEREFKTSYGRWFGYPRQNKNDADVAVFDFFRTEKIKDFKLHLDNPSVNGMPSKLYAHRGALLQGNAGSITKALLARADKLINSPQLVVDNLESISATKNVVGM